MKLLILSDTHVGHPGWNGFGEGVFSQAREMAREEAPDVVLFCGDLVEEGKGSGKRLIEGLRLLSDIPAGKRLWVAGNNDLEPLYGKIEIEKYPEHLQEQAALFGVHLLDYEPVYIDGYAFVGNFGGWDLSLWREPRVKSSEWPSTYGELYEGMDSWHWKKVGLGIRDLFNLHQRRLRKHLQQMSGRKIILTTHTTPDPGMVLYDHSPEFDFRNAAMGWNDELTGQPLHKTYRNIIHQFCGHTHRDQTIERKGYCPLVNVSGKSQPILFDI